MAGDSITPDTGSFKVGENRHKQPFRLEYYTDSTTGQRVYSLQRDQANQRDDRESIHNLDLAILRKLAAIVQNLDR